MGQGGSRGEFCEKLLEVSLCPALLAAKAKPSSDGGGSEERQEAKSTDRPKQEGREYTQHIH